MKILFVHNHSTSFVRQDLDCLRHLHEVTELYLHTRRVNLIAVWNQARHHDLVFGWFASWHTFLPTLFARCLNRPSVLVIGGYDLANIPSIGYGHQRGGLKNGLERWTSRATMWLASALVTNSKYSEREARVNAGLVKRQLHVIYHGVPDTLAGLPAEPREHMAITIGNLDRTNLQRKGLEPFVRAAELLPDVKFVMIGAWKDDAIDRLREIAGSNVTFTGLVDDNALSDYCSRASVYVQASRHEGFGLAVAEAMLAGCIPVVTKDGALPEVAGECGIYCEADARDIARAITEAMLMPESSRVKARERVLTHFTPQKRRALLAGVISQVAPDVFPLVNERAG